MLEAVAIREPEELVRVRRKRHHVVNARVEIVNVDPGLGCFGHDFSTSARLYVEEKELHYVLRTVERDHRERIGSTRPVNARNVELAFLASIQPGVLAGGYVHDAQAHC